ncbi:MAG: DUF3187 family protein [Gammaproteobacteria bacterium]|nr:DUF3187 family protein [Gammaproteobacteria bacterium]
MDDTPLTRPLYCLCLLLYTFAGVADELGLLGVDELGPLRVRNASPVAVIFGLPRSMGGAVLRSGSELSLSAEIVNNFTGAISGSTFATFDGETTVLEYGYRRAAGNGWEWGVDVPYIVHNGGILDGFIDGWHDLFGLPSKRSGLPKNRIDYRVAYQGRTEFAILASTRGWGDVQFWGARSLLRDDGRALAARAQIKVPTGEVERATGSGAADFAVWLDYTDARLLKGRLVATASLGLTALGKGDLIPSKQKRLAGTGHVGLRYAINGKLSVIGQLDLHSELIDSGVAQATGAVLLGTLGGRVHITDRLWLDLGVTEDLAGPAGSDVAFLISLRGRP